MAFDISTPLAPTKLGETALPQKLTDLEYLPNDKNLYLLDTQGVMVIFVDENPPYVSALSDENGDVQRFRSPAVTQDDIAIALDIYDGRFFVLHNRSLSPLSEDALDETGLVPLTRFHEFEKAGGTETPEDGESSSAEDPGGELPAFDFEFSPFPAELSAEYQGYDMVTTLDYGYLAGGDEVVVLDLSDSTNYFVQTTVPLTDTGVSSLADLVIDGNYLIALYPGGGEVFDLSIPALPISLGTFIGTYPRHAVVGNRLVNENETTLFVADYSNGLSLYTITDDGVQARGFLDLDIPPETARKTTVRLSRSTSRSTKPMRMS